MLVGGDSVEKYRSKRNEGKEGWMERKESWLSS